MCHTFITTRLAFFNWLLNAKGDFNDRSNDTWIDLYKKINYYYSKFNTKMKLTFEFVDMDLVEPRLFRPVLKPRRVKVCWPKRP